MWRNGLNLSGIHSDMSSLAFTVTGLFFAFNPSDAHASLLEDSAFQFIRIASWSKLKDRLQAQEIPLAKAVKILLEAEDILDQLKPAKGLSFETQVPKVLLLSNKAVKYIDSLKVTSIALDITCDEVYHAVEMPKEVMQSKRSLTSISQSLSQQENVWEVGTLITSTQFQSEIRDARIGIDKIVSQVPEKVMKDAKYMRCNQMMRDASNFEDMKLIMDSRHCSQTFSEFEDAALNSW